jgi:hypothetical protein
MARRGGFRARRYVVPGVVPVWVQGGRWGPRRARVENCLTLAAELVYDQLIRSRKPFGPGSRVKLMWSPNGTTAPSWEIDSEVRPNAVWRKGRLFFLCPRCQRRATRLYVPLANVEPRCRQCWGLSYVSQSWSYQPTGPLGAIFGPVAYATTDMRREERRKAALERYAARRKLDRRE